MIHLSAIAISLFAQLYPTLPTFGQQSPIVVNNVQPAIPPSVAPAYNNFLNAQAYQAQTGAILNREQIINQRLGSQADNAAARGLVGSILESEIRAGIGR